MTAQRLVEWFDCVEDVHPAVITDDGTLTYSDLASIDPVPTVAGRVATVPGEFSVRSVAAFVRLFVSGAILVPGEQALTVVTAEHPLIQQLVARHRAGLVLFTSGSSGPPKAALHDLDLLVEQALDRGRYHGTAYRTLAFLRGDHIGGVNTLLRTLTRGGTLIVPASRTVPDVCAAIARHRVELLPTTPSFLALLCAAEAWTRWDLSSLEIVTYGTEPMPEAVLERVAAALPHVSLRQTYGLSELGILRAQSRASGSLWVRVGGDGYETRVVDGELHIRARTAMLGYLNAPSPFDADGWLNTHDRVEQDGEWLRILGRTSDLINVGGLKVAPQDVEAVLLTMPGVVDATVYGEPNAVLGQVVAARLTLAAPIDNLRHRVRWHCDGTLPAHAIPLRVTVTSAEALSIRGKKVRR